MANNRHLYVDIGDRNLQGPTLAQVQGATALQSRARALETVADSFPRMTWLKP